MQQCGMNVEIGMCAAVWCESCYRNVSNSVGRLCIHECEQLKAIATLMCAARGCQLQ